MRRRMFCSLALSGASAAALAACGADSTLLETGEQAPAESAQTDPTAAPAEPKAETAQQAAEPTAAPTLDLPNLGTAPEITLTSWFNSEPITLASLEGKAAAMIVFWTYT